jgi:hypothetical protein
MKLTLRALFCSSVVATAACLPLQAQERTIIVTGTIESPTTSGSGFDNAGLFGPAGASLVGDSYTETITTDPSLNSSIACHSLSCFGTIGGVPNNIGPGAPYNLTVTVNGVPFTWTESVPYLNHAYLIDALSINDTSTTLQDQVYQEADSGNLNSFGIFSYILAYSHTTPFVPNLNFNQTINQSGGFDPGSNTNFNYTLQNGTPAGITTIFYGSIDTLSVNSVPSPGTLPLMLVGLAGLALTHRKRVTAQR